MGGLPKKAYQQNKATQKLGLPFLTLDGGSILFKRPLSNKKQTAAAQERLAAAAIVDSYNLMGYEAAAVGNHDLSAGLDFFKKMSKLARFPWLSANLVNSETQQPIFPPSIIINKAGLRIAIIGLTADTPLNPVGGQESAIILPWRQVLAPLVAELSKQSDLLILLSNLKQAQNREVAESFTNIHLIIQSSGQDNNHDPILKNNTLICGAAKRGKFMAMLNIQWQPSKAWSYDADKQIATAQKALAGHQGKLDRYYRKYDDPEKDLQAKPRSLKAFHLLLARHKAATDELKHLIEDRRVSKNIIGKPSTYNNIFTALNRNIPNDSKVSVIIDSLAR